MSDSQGLYWIYRTLRRKVMSSNPLFRRIRDMRSNFLKSSRNKAVQSGGLKTAERVVACLEQADITVFLMYGTLLGAVREHGLIAHDYDLDFGVIIDDDFSWDKVTEALKAGGFEIARSWSFSGNVTEQAYYSDGFMFDVFGLYPFGGATPSLRTYVYQPPKESKGKDVWDNVVKYFDIPYFDQVRLTNVGDIRLPVPVNSEDVVRTIYGPNWKVPDPNWVTGTDWEILEGAVGRFRGYKEK